MTCDISCFQPNLASLPLDILIALMDYLHPVDLIALRKTCRALHDASQQRIVWIRALVDVCIANDVFLPTFQLNEMTIDELVRAATSPSRWLMSVRRGNASGPKAVLEPSARSPKPIGLGLSPNDEVQGLFLVPGGRFVTILTLHSLQLCDLAWAETEPRIGRSVAAAIMNQQYNVTFCVQPTKDGMGLRIAITSYPMDTIANKYKQITIYEIFPLEKRPILNEIALLAVDSNASTITPRLAGDQLVFLDGSIIKVWDFVNDLWTEWNTQRDLINTAFLTLDAIFLLSNQETVVWKIPELRPIDEEPRTTPAENIMSFPPILGSGSMKMCHYGTLSDWHWNKQESLLDVFCKGGGVSTMTRYKLVSPFTPPSTSPYDRPQTSIGPSRLFNQTLTSDLDISNTALQYRYCEGDLMACSISKDVVLGYISVLGEEHQTFAHMAMGLKHDTSRIVDYSVCPLAGKVCYVTDENEIMLVDLFDDIC